MAQGKKIRFIYNPNSGLIHPITYVRRLIERYFPSNLCSYDIKTTEGIGHATTLAKEAVSEACDIVVAIGGDGTVNEIASALMNTDLHFGIIPIGSGNGLARGLGIPLLLGKAVRLITTGSVRAIDVGLANGRHFFTTSGFGFDAAIGKKFGEYKMRGPAPYYLAGVTEYFSYKQPEFKITCDNKKIKVKALVVAVVNVKQYGNSAIIAPHAIPDDGLLDLCIIRSVKLLPTVLHLPKLFTGQIEKAPNVEFYQGRNFTIVRDKSDVYQLDGEVIDEKEEKIQITIVPKGLKVIVNNAEF